MNTREPVSAWRIFFTRMTESWVLIDKNRTIIGRETSLPVFERRWDYKMSWVVMFSWSLAWKNDTTVCSTDAEVPVWRSSAEEPSEERTAVSASDWSGRPQMTTLTRREYVSCSERRLERSLFVVNISAFVFCRAKTVDFRVAFSCCRMPHVRRRDSS